MSRTSLLAGAAGWLGLGSPRPRLDSRAQGGDVSVHHHMHHLLERHTRLPAQLAPRFGGIGQQHVHLGRTIETRINDHMPPPIQTGAIESQTHKLLDTMRLAGADDVIVRLILLQHQPHGPYVIAGKPPITLGLQIAQTQFLIQPVLDASDAVCDFAADKFHTASWTLVVEQDAGAGKQAIALPIIYRDVVAVNLGDAVGRTRMERSGFRLRRLTDLAEHLTGTGLVE